MPIKTPEDATAQTLKCPIEPVNFTLRLKLPEGRELESSDLFIKGCRALTNCRSSEQQVFMGSWLIRLNGGNVPAAIVGIRRAFLNSGGLR